MSSKIPTPTAGSHGLYIHVPFCRKKCPYCHFYVVKGQISLQEAYTTALCQEFTRIRSELGTPRTLYLGGGTPTELNFEQLERLLTLTTATHETTVEANPENITPALIQHLKNLGVNRLSIGVQSLNDHSLSLIGRLHTTEKTIQAIHTAYENGITNLSIDLMYDLPSQTPKSFQKTLERLQELPITHLSLYNMTIEPNTAFHRKKSTLSLPNDTQSLQMHQMALDHLDAIGLKRYEISAFAKPGFEAQHNTGYWKGTPFWGLGPSAFSYVKGSRFQNIANLQKYIQAITEDQSAMHFKETLPYPQNHRELFVIGLRLLEGALLPPCPLPEIADLKEYLIIENGRAKLTEKGRLYYEDVAATLI